MKEEKKNHEEREKVKEDVDEREKIKEIPLVRDGGV